MLLGIEENTLILISEVYGRARLGESYDAMCSKIRLVEASQACG